MLLLDALPAADEAAQQPSPPVANLVLLAQTVGAAPDMPAESPAAPPEAPPLPPEAVEADVRQIGADSIVPGCTQHVLSTWVPASSKPHMKHLKVSFEKRGLLPGESKKPG